MTIIHYTDCNLLRLLSEVVPYTAVSLKPKPVLIALNFLHLN
ncbi:Uncharacterised protein [Yersinia frederiksenii]|nr:Uncharacterised protein [Yersinia frederiksenii]